MIDEETLLCQSCGCYVSHEEPPSGPELECAAPFCPCHAVYWMTVPENVKRALVGDR